MMMAAMNSGPRGRLRTATHAAHARVDACFPRGLATTTEYRQYLLGMHALVHALERAMVGLELPSTWQAWRKPERVQWLLDDMVAVGAMPMHDGPGLRIDSVAEAAGALYVVEGSALGATQLLQDTASMGLTERHGARFLHRHGGDAAGARWREYVRCLEGCAFGPDEERALFEAAARTCAYAEHEFLRAARRTDGDE
jgi:heme oxygenase